MKRVSIEEVTPGMRLARTLYYHYGGVMLAAGALIENAQISRLKSFGFRGLYVYDEDTASVDVYDYIDERVRFQITKRVTELFQSLRNETMHMVETGELRAGSLDEVRRRLASDQVRSILDRARLQENFSADVEKIIDGILADEQLCLCVGTIKTQQSHIYDHSMEVTLHSAILGRKLGFNRREMREMLVGSLLHDIGYIFIPDDVLHKTDPLTVREQDLLKQHAIYGYYLLKDREDVNLLSAHVAYQHHERQDGKGYPRRIKGNNRVARPSDSLVDTSGNIHRYAEVVAVPNYYDNLVSHLPNRPALTPDQAVRRIQKASGTMLNREVVDYFLSYLPVYPIGTQVSVVKGEYAGYRGVVSRTHLHDLDRPTVLLLEKQKQKLDSPIEIDLREREDVKIKCILT